MTDSLLIVVHAFVSRVSMSVTVDETLLPRSVNLSSSFRELPFSVEMSPVWLKHIYSVLCALTWRPMPAESRSRLCSRVSAWAGAHLIMELKRIKSGKIATSYQIHFMKFNDTNIFVAKLGHVYTQPHSTWQDATKGQSLNGVWIQCFPSLYTYQEIKFQLRMSEIGGPNSNPG